MAQARTKASPRPGTGSKKVALTVRLDPARVQQLQSAAAAQNRSLTNYVETVLLRDLSAQDEAARVITMRVAPDAPAEIDRNTIIRAPDESDEAYAKRQDLMMALWAIPDTGG
ncbi:MAG: hypothetical protein JSS43_06445 [Proteobacteria bacterium]|nr:hypothetical protein [Pseudomonadota bacterium]